MHGLLWIPFYFVTILAEWRLLARSPNSRRMGYETKDTAASVAMALGMKLIDAGALIGAMAFWAWLYEYRLFTAEWVWWTFPLLFVAEDFCFYWYHRSHHGVRMLWAGHLNHHSSRHYNLSTALRASWTTPFTGPMFWAPLALLGFDVPMILLAKTVSMRYQYCLHTELVGRMGWLGLVFSTPSHHRVHHGRNPLYLDRNHGGILIIWDRLFGTFQAELDDEPVDYGLSTNIDTFNPIRIAFHEWVDVVRDSWRAKTWRGRVGAFLMPPGLNEDGTGSTAAVVRAEALAERRNAEATPQSP